MFPLAPLTQEIEKLLATEQAVDVVELRVLTNQLEFAWLRTIDEYARSEQWVEEGFAVAASALRAKCGLTQGGANASLKLATHKELGQIMQRITDALDGDDGAATANEKHARRRLHMSEMLDGMVRFDGLLDPELGQRLRAQVNAMARTLRDQDPGRTPAQVRADALVELAEIGTARADVGAGRETITDVAIHVDLSGIEARGSAALATEIRQHPGKLPKATLRRLTCDCRISRVITDGASQVLDIGRASRNPTIAQFRALVARDKGCSWPGCDRPPGWCQAHHIRHWLDGGSTNLDNLRLLCRCHHRRVHEGGKDPPVQ